MELKTGALGTRFHLDGFPARIAAVLSGARGRENFGKGRILTTEMAASDLFLKVITSLPTMAEKNILVIKIHSKRHTNQHK